MDNQLLKNLSQKLGVSSQKILRKAEELMRLLSVQFGSGLSLSISARTVICLEIAALASGAPLDKTLAIKLSGLNRPQYVSSSQTVNRLLNVSSNVSIADLCITYSATNVRDFALQILQEYENGLQNKSEVDLSLPVFQTAAVVAACGVKKIKVDKQKLYAASCSKRAVYNKVVEAMVKVAEKLHTQKTVKTGSKRTKTLLDLVEENMQNNSSPKRKKCDVEDNSSQSEDELSGQQETDFEAWKKRILEAAGAVQ